MRGKEYGWLGEREHKIHGNDTEEYERVEAKRSRDEMKRAQREKWPHKTWKEDDENADEGDE